MDTIQTQQNHGLVERSRTAILTAGYQFVVWKTKIKKNTVTFKKRIVMFYF